MNQSYEHVNARMMYVLIHPMLHSRVRNVFRAQLYKNNARVLLSHILSIVNSDWLQHARSVRVMYECIVVLT